MRLAPLMLCLLVPALPATAQQGAADDGPMSAIDWLSETVRESAAPGFGPFENGQPFILEPPIADSATTPEITVTPLDNDSPDAVGLLSPRVTGLPLTLWSHSDEATLVTLIRASRAETLPAIQELMVTLMLAAADPPMGAGPDGALFLARVDKLLDLGALDPAQALLEAAGPDRPELFRRWFDVSLLTGTEAEACRVMQDKPTLSPTVPARIFCLARSEDWTAAALTLNTARALGDVSDEEDLLLSRFLDPDLFEGLPPLRAPTRPSPLVFRLREAIGEGLVTSGLPRAFAHADLRQTVGWRSQMEAAERLARHGAISETTLFTLYTQRTPAASGGVWDRATAIQRLETALSQRDPAAVGTALQSAWAAMESARTEVAFARNYADQILSLPLEPQAQALTIRIGLLSPSYETIAIALQNPAQDQRLWQGIARGDTAGLSTTDPRVAAVLAAFAAPPALDGLPVPLPALVAEDRLGEALLRVAAMLDQGIDGDSDALRDALILLRVLGMEDIARRTALQFLLLDRQP